jgi:nicotinate-nucleotide pyrophosphorylase (carboxylating)
MTPFELPGVRALVTAALAEDVGCGDITTQLTVPVDRRAMAVITAKQAGVLAGGPLVDGVFDALNARDVTITHRVDDGTSFTAGMQLISIEGLASNLLIAERTALNFLQQLSGVATLTRRYVDAVVGTKARIIDTRKTTPGLRVLEKYAVRMGGGPDSGYRQAQGRADWRSGCLRRAASSPGRTSRGSARHTGTSPRRSVRWPVRTFVVH